MQTVPAGLARGLEPLRLAPAQVVGGQCGDPGGRRQPAGLTLVREPFEGARYREIHEAALATDLQIAKGQDYCVAARDQWATQVTEACQAHAATRRAMTGMLVTAGVAAASTIVLAILLARARRGASTGPVAALHGGTVTLRF